FDHHAMVQPAVPLRPNSGLPEFGTLIGRSRIYPTSAGERSDRACEIRVRGISFTSSSPLTRNGREAPIPTSPLRGPAGRGGPAGSISAKHALGLRSALSPLWFTARRHGGRPSRLL